MSDNHEKNQKRENTQQQQPYYYFPQASPAYYPVNQYRQFFPQTQMQMQMPTQQQQQQQPQIPGMLPMEQSYVENILRLNRGKHVTVHMTFEQNKEWNAMIFRGVIEAAGRDHLIISDPQTGKRQLLLMIYLDYVTFDEEINYEYPFGGMAPGNGFSTYNPR